jgi:hypothetical protein
MENTESLFYRSLLEIICYSARSVLLVFTVKSVILVCIEVFRSSSHSAGHIDMGVDRTSLIVET